MEQEGAVHQGVVGHLRERGEVNSPSITCPDVPGQGQEDRPLVVERTQALGSKPALSLTTWESLDRHPLRTSFHPEMVTPPQGVWISSVSSPSSAQ